jgi:hypothetical protein
MSQGLQKTVKRSERQLQHEAGTEDPSEDERNNDGYYRRE